MIITKDNGTKHQLINTYFFDINNIKNCSFGDPYKVNNQ